MTELENKATQLEISPDWPEEGIYHALEKGTNMQFSVLQGITKVDFISPIEGCLSLHAYKKSSQCRLVLQDHIHTLTAGESLLIRLRKKDTFTIHTFSPKDKVLLILFNCPPVAVSTKHKPSSNSVLIHELASSQVLLCLKRIFQLHKKSTWLNNLKMQPFLMDIIVQQIEKVFLNTEPQKASLTDNHYEKVKQVRELIEEDLSINYTISELAKAVGTNKQYLQKHFKLLYGKTILNYMIGLRMELAKNLIMSGKYRITEVARMVGYKHATHFTTAFKKYYGVIPNSLKYSFIPFLCRIFLDTSLLKFICR